MIRLRSISIRPGPCGVGGLGSSLLGAAPLVDGGAHQCGHDRGRRGVDGVIANPWFGRDVPVTWWVWPELITTAVLAGMLAASYVRSPLTPTRRDREGRVGVVGGVISLFAVGCPVCNKLVLLALGTSGAVTYFQPVQPILAVVSVGLLAWVLSVRIRRENACPADRPKVPQSAGR